MRFKRILFLVIKKYLALITVTELEAPEKVVFRFE